MTDPRRCVLISVDAPSLHKVWFSVQLLRGGVCLPKKESHLTHREIFGMGEDKVC